MLLKIKITSYPPEAEALVQIWAQHAKSITRDLGFVTFQNKRPTRPRSDRRRIAGLPAQSLSYLKDDQELVKMTTEHFIYLLAKAGVQMEITEEED